MSCTGYRILSGIFLSIKSLKWWRCSDDALKWRRSISILLKLGKEKKSSDRDNKARGHCTMFTIRNDGNKTSVFCV